MAKKEEWKEVKRSYLGDVTALEVDGSDTGRPRLLVGSGGVLAVHEARCGVSDALCRARVFQDGARVHGVAVSSGPSPKIVAAYGEERARFYRLARGREGEPALELVCGVGPLGHWVMDAAFLPTPEGSVARVALALSNNSVTIVDVDGSAGEARTAAVFECARTYLLYSARLFCSEQEDRVFVAAGTIFNSVLVWSFPLSATEGGDGTICGGQVTPCPPRCSLAGHQGSILKLCWSRDGRRLASCSDDRTARVWDLGPTAAAGAPHDGVCASLEAEKVIYGHDGRLWDCLFSDDSKTLVTASEDCTCRFWSLSRARSAETDTSDLVATVGGHRGRGVWRIAATGDHLFTAGADGAVKVWLLRHCLVGGAIASTSLPSMRIASFEHSLPSAEGDARAAALAPTAGLRKAKKKSNKEWVRCLALAGLNAMYVGTNQGIVYAKSATGGPSDWQPLFASPRQMPLLCMEVIRPRDVDVPAGAHLVCSGDASGYFTVVAVAQQGASVGPCLQWRAHERRLLGIHRGKLATGGQVFSSDISGEVKWWEIDLGGLHAGGWAERPRLKARMQSPLKIRVLGVDYCASSGLVVCGDQSGNIMAFRHQDGRDPDVPLDLAILMDRQHGMEAVSFLRCEGSGVVLSGGRDAKMYTYEVRGDAEEGAALCPVGIHVEKHVTAIEDKVELGGRGTYVAGFQSSDFLVWNAEDNCQVIKIRCGGWRRPHSLFVEGGVGATFAHLKDHVIHVQRLISGDGEVPQGSESSDLSNTVTPGFHGLEIHSTQILPTSRLGKPGDTFLAITGAEDGLVRFSEWGPDGETGHFKVHSSGIVGECVAGTQVRALSLCLPAAAGGAGGVYIAAVGAKEVATVWRVSFAPGGGQESRLQTKFVSMMEPKGGLRPKTKRKAGEGKSAADLRYMAVDTFSHELRRGVDVLFMLVSLSDATVRLVALEIDEETGSSEWLGQACHLVGGSQNPTLSVGCVVLGDDGTTVAFTGSTDGMVCCWDISEAVRGLLCRLRSGAKACEGGSEVSPLVRIEGVHDSGVNAMTTRAIEGVGGGGNYRVCVVSGGDDQALHAKDIYLRQNQGGDLAFIGDSGVRIPNAHHSALRGVWTDGTVAATTGIDQRLNLWRLIRRVGEGVRSLKVQLLRSLTVEAGETESLDAAMADDGGACLVALAGRGLSVVELSNCSLKTHLC